MNTGSDMTGRSTAAWAIPDEGEVLRSDDLRRQTLFTLAQADRRPLRGGWGFFRRPDLPSGEGANRFEIHGNLLTVKNLGLIAPQGVVAEAGNLSDRFRADEATIRVLWTLPESRRDGDHPLIGISADDPPSGDSVARFVAEVGKISGSPPTLELTAPALSLDCAAPLATAWNALADSLKELAEFIERSGRGTPFERALTGDALRRPRELPLGTDPAWAVHELRAAVGTLAAFVEDRAPKAACDDAGRLCDAARACLARAGSSLDALRRSLDDARGQAEHAAGITDWLASFRTGPTPVSLVRVRRHGGQIFRWTYRLPANAPAGTLSVSPPEGVEPGKYQYGFGDEMVDFHKLRASGEITEKERAGSELLQLKGPYGSRQAVPVVEIAPRGSGEGK